MTARGVITVANFYDDAHALAAQVRWRDACHRAGLGPPPASPPAGALIGRADRCLPQELLADFLGALRRWAFQSLGTRHASTPELWVAAGERGFALGAAAPRAAWRYLFCLGAAELSVVSERPELRRFGRLNYVRVSHGDLLACAASSLVQARARRGAIFLGGFLW